MTLQKKSYNSNTSRLENKIQSEGDESEANRSNNNNSNNNQSLLSLRIESHKQQHNSYLFMNNLWRVKIQI